jgi:two-component system CheB/CheR fusion protein
MATIFLDRTLRITRFTPSAVVLFRLIASDIGRPLTDLQHRLDYPNLGTDSEQVLQTLVPVNREVRSDGQWFLARIQPYRTVEDQIAGVVLTFVDITEAKRSAAEVQARNAELERFNRAAVGREVRMLELKREINALLAARGEPPKYAVENEDPP